MTLPRLIVLLSVLVLVVSCDKETIAPKAAPPGPMMGTTCRIDYTPVARALFLPDTTITEYDTLRYQYAPDGRLLTAEGYDGDQVTFAYAGDRITGSVYTVPQYDLQFEGIYTYDAGGRLQEVRYPNWYTSFRHQEYRLEVDSFFYDDAGRRTGMSTWAEVDDHLFTGYVPVVERSYEYAPDGNITRVVELEYYSDQYAGREANRRVTERTGFTQHRSLLYGTPLRHFYTYSLSPFLHEWETSVLTDPRGNRKSTEEVNFVFTPEFIIPEGYYTWGRPYTCY